MIEKIADAEKVKIARAYIQRLIDEDVATLAAELDPSLRNGQEVEQLNAMRAILPPGAATVTQLVGYTVNYTSGKTIYNVTFQFGYDSKWFLVNAAWREVADMPRVIMGMRVVALERSLQETNGFNFTNAGIWHYLILAGAIIVPLFILATLVVCIRTKLPRRKWLWIIFVLFGVTNMSINWTTGETSFSLLSIRLFGASSMTQGAFAPWIVTVALPAGAIAFWFKRRQLIKDRLQAAAAPTEPPLL